MPRRIGKQVTLSTLDNLIKLDYTLKQISLTLQIGPTSVRYWLKKYGLKLRRGPAGKYPKDLLLHFKCSCGETEPSQFYGNKKTVCMACHNRYRYRKAEETKQRVVLALGGSCTSCGYKKCLAALHIHHQDPREKDIAFRNFKYWSWERVLKEIQGCLLLCANCHAEIHSNN